MHATKPRERQRLNSEINLDFLEPPSLIEIQNNSFKAFVEKGIKDELESVSPIVSYNGKYELEFLDGIRFDEPEYSFEECQIREITYAAALRVSIRFVNKETGEVVEQDVFMSDIPMMSDSGTFLINGAERVIVSQFVRSPGVYFRRKVGPTPDRIQYIATVIPSRGAWLEIETDKDNVLHANVNKVKKLPITTLLGALGYSNEDVLREISNKSVIQRTLDKAPIESADECLLEIYKKLRPGDPVTLEGAKQLLHGLFFNLVLLRY